MISRRPEKPAEPTTAAAALPFPARAPSLKKSVVVGVPLGEAAERPATSAAAPSGSSTLKEGTATPSARPVVRVVQLNSNPLATTSPPPSDGSSGDTGARGSSSSAGGGEPSSSASPTLPPAPPPPLPPPPAGSADASQRGSSAGGASDEGRGVSSGGEEEALFLEPSEDLLDPKLSVHHPPGLVIRRSAAYLGGGGAGAGAGAGSGNPIGTAGAPGSAANLGGAAPLKSAAPSAAALLPPGHRQQSTAAAAAAAAAAGAQQQQREKSGSVSAAGAVAAPSSIWGIKGPGGAGRGVSMARSVQGSGGTSTRTLISSHRAMRDGRDNRGLRGLAKCVVLRARQALRRVWITGSAGARLGSGVRRHVRACACARVQARVAGVQRLDPGGELCV